MCSLSSIPPVQATLTSSLGIFLIEVRGLEVIAARRNKFAGVELSGAITDD